MPAKIPPMPANAAKAALDAIDVSDPEKAHSDADEILLKCVPKKVREAYNDVTERASWWASA